MCWGAALRPRPADTWARGGPTTASHPRGTGALRPLRGVVVLPLSDPPTPRMHLRLPPCTPLRRYSTTPAVFTRGRTTRHVVRIEETHVVLGRRPTDGRRSVPATRRCTTGVESLPYPVHHGAAPSTRGSLRWMEQLGGGSLPPDSFHLCTRGLHPSMLAGGGVYLTRLSGGRVHFNEPSVVSRFEHHSYRRRRSVQATSRCSTTRH
jgi:hypothetical protein